MEKIKLIADSTCDLSRELIETYNVDIIPLNIVMDEKEYRDGIDILPDEIYHWSDRTGNTPKTSAPSYDSIHDVLTEYDQEGMSILFFGLSEDMSTTCNVVRMVGEELECAKVYVINSMNLSTGIGMQIIRAAELVKEGKTAESIVEMIQREQKDIQISFVLDKLTFLARGGRCSSVMALFGNRLKIHPKICVQNGKMDVDKKYRGKMEHVILKYIEDLEDDMKNARKDYFFITHSGVPNTWIDLVKNRIEEKNDFKNIYITRAGGVISSHCGPGTLGVVFYRGK